MTQYGFAVVFAAAKLRDTNREIMQRVVQENGDLLEYAGPTLRGDRELVEMALKNGPYPFRFASPKLRADMDMSKFAVELDEESTQVSRETFCKSNFRNELRAWWRCSCCICLGGWGSDGFLGRVW